MDILLKYFTTLKDEQLDQFGRLQPLYETWNANINVISRKDIEHLYERHILHALALAKVMPLMPDAHILDLGTGGGLPGLPLAILFPETRFTLIDGTGKKIMVVNEIAQALGLKNVEAKQVRAEELKTERFDFVVSRAVADLSQLLLWSQRLIHKKHKHKLPNGLFAYKGGNLRPELAALPRSEYSEVFDLAKFFEEEFFKEKHLVYVQG